jgi:hypothetical protein
MICCFEHYGVQVANWSKRNGPAVEKQGRFRGKKTKMPQGS